jgi:hypothetical protein
VTGLLKKIETASMGERQISQLSLAMRRLRSEVIPTIIIREETKLSEQRSKRGCLCKQDNWPVKKYWLDVGGK